MAILKSDRLIGLYLPINSKQLENVVINALGKCIEKDGDGSGVGR